MEKGEVRDLAPASFLSHGLPQATTGEAHNTTAQSTSARQAVNRRLTDLSGNCSPARTRGYNARSRNDRTFRTRGPPQAGQLPAANGRLSKRRKRVSSSLPRVRLSGKQPSPTS